MEQDFQNCEGELQIEQNTIIESESVMQTTVNREAMSEAVETETVEDSDGRFEVEENAAVETETGGGSDGQSVTEENAAAETETGGGSDGQSVAEENTASKAVRVETKLEKYARLMSEERSRLRREKKRKEEKIAKSLFEILGDVLGREIEEADVQKFRQYVSDNAKFILALKD